MLLFVALHQQGQQFDGLGFRGGGLFQSRQLEECSRIGCQLLVIVYNARSAVRDHFRRVGKDCAHFVPNLLSQLYACISTSRISCANCSTTASTARSTSGDSSTPAAKLAPSMPYTTRCGGSWSRERASSTASATLK